MAGPLFPQGTQSTSVVRHGLEIGSRRGGLASLFAREYSMRMISSDYLQFDKSIRNNHQKLGVVDKVDYLRADGTRLPLADESLDLVTFKSVLGNLGTLEKQREMMAEIYRVLRPGGVLLFAENLRGSPLHRFGRRWFRRWGTEWRYVTLAEMAEFLAPFQRFCLKSTGFFSAFARHSRLYGVLATVDGLIDPVVPRAWRYVVYGEAIKQGTLAPRNNSPTANASS